MALPWVVERCLGANDEARFHASIEGLRLLLTPFPQEEFKATVEFVDPVVTLPARLLTATSPSRFTANALSPAIVASAYTSSNSAPPIRLLFRRRGWQ